MKKRILIAYCLSVMVAGGDIASAQGFVSDVSKRGTTAAPFLNISQGVRASGMGSAFVAVSDDASSMYWNPGGLARVPGVSTHFEHTQWIAGTRYNFIAASYHLSSYGSIGIGMIMSDIGDMDVTTIQEPDGTGETFSVVDVAAGITFSLRLTNTFSIGFTPKFIRQSIWKMSADAVALDVGVLYDTPFPGVTLGMSITNFGTEMKLSGNSTLVLYDLDKQSTGNNERTPANLETLAWDLPLNFRVGLRYEPFKIGDHRIVIAADAAHPNDNYESVNLGLEYTLFDLLSLRGGYKSLFLDDSEESYSAGIGLRQYLLGNIAVQVDYAYMDFGRLQNVQKFSIGFQF